MFDVDWNTLLVPSESVAEILVRGTLIYLSLFAALRLLPRRTLSEAGTSDILVIVLIADAVQNGMAGEYRSVSEGLALAAVIIGWAFLFDWLDHRFPQWQLASGRPLVLIADGKLVHRNLQRQLITEDELMSQLREHGLDSPDRVRRAFIEGDGRFTVLLEGGEPFRKPRAKRRS